MKAKVLLNWFIDNFVYDALNPTGIDRVAIEDGDEFESKQDFFESFFGATPEEEIPTGDYLYIWEDCVGDSSLKALRDLADKIYELDRDGEKIFLIRIED